MNRGKDEKPQLPASWASYICPAPLMEDSLTQKKAKRYLKSTKLSTNRNRRQ